MILLQNIHKYYAAAPNKHHVLKGIDLQINKGELVAIMGNPGAGKSTLLNLLGILDSYDLGQYTLGNASIKDLSLDQATQYRNQLIGFVLPSFNLVPFNNVLENVALPLYHQKIDRAERHTIALACLERVGLKDWAQHWPNELTSEQQLLVTIARALVTSPKLILADEPTTGQDPQTVQVVLDILKEVSQAGVTVVIMTKEKDIAAQANRVIWLQDGQLLEPVSPARR